MKFIAEITGIERISADPQIMVDAHIVSRVRQTDGRNQSVGGFLAPIFERVLDAMSEIGPFTKSDHGFAIDAASGQIDLDRMSAELRVVEAKAGLEDGTMRLIAFRFPDLKSLADAKAGLIATHRLFALAHDEARLRAELGSGEHLLSAPLIYARARCVAEARNCGKPVYLKPDWSHGGADHRSIISQAKADGFDGMIGPVELAPLVRSA